MQYVGVNTGGQSVIEKEIRLGLKLYDERHDKT